MHVQELLDEEVRSLAGQRYARGEGYAGVRCAWVVRRLPIRVPPRVRGEEGEIPLRAHAPLQGSGEVDEVLLRRML